MWEDRALTLFPPTLMIITIFTDDKDSWFVEHGRILEEVLRQLNYQTDYVLDKSDIKSGDICFLLSCSNIVDKSVLSLNRHNIVVHASDLPAGKGFSPLQWQILEERNDIILTLFEAIEAVDAGDYYIKDSINFDGTELHEELRNRLAEKIIQMCVKYVIEFNKMKPKQQIGAESFYKRRTKADDEIDIDKTIRELFNHFRIADNNRSPLYFNHLGHKYFLTVNKA
jgi:methionyl-tRNA formyltransferase